MAKSLQPCLITLINDESLDLLCLHTLIPKARGEGLAPLVPEMAAACQIEAIRLLIGDH